MKKTKKLILLLIGYFGSIFVFSIIYYIYWILNTSNFIINQDFNEITIKSTYFFDQIPDSAALKSHSLTTRQINDLIIPYFDSIKFYSREVQNLTKSITINEIKDSINYKKLWASHDKNVYSLIENETNKLMSEKNKIINKIDSIKASSQRQNYNYDSDVWVAKANYQVSLIDYEIAKLRYKIISEGLSNIVKFYDDSLFQEAQQIQDEIIKARNTKTIALNRINELKIYISKILKNYHTSRSEKIGFLDFVYFSVISATSTGYGDILPNNQTIRIIVTIQIMLSLLLFGLFLNLITKS